MLVTRGVRPEVVRPSSVHDNPIGDQESEAFRKDLYTATFTYSSKYTRFVSSDRAFLVSSTKARA